MFLVTNENMGLCLYIAFLQLIHTCSELVDYFETNKVLDVKQLVPLLTRICQ